MRRVLRQRMGHVLAVLGIFVIAMAVSGVILGHQRLYLPKWFPFVGTDFYKVKAEFSTAQAVVPGQGQTVDIAGVPIGEIGAVDLENGVAVVTLNIRRKYAPIYKNATMLLRPKTGLKDMVVEMDPGTKSAGALPDGGHIPIEATEPDINLDETLSSLDTDTRNYLQILVNAAGEGLSGKHTPAALRETFKRFEPTNRDLARITSLLQQRRKNLARVIHNFALISNELGSRDAQLAQFVGSSNANFRAFASQQASIRDSLSLLPGTLATARSTLVQADAFARQLGPSLQSLRPAARELGPALAAARPFLRTTTPVIQHQLRPFARDVRPTVRSLRVAAQNLEPLTPHLVRTFRFVNTLLNALAYNPPGEDEGYLFYASWGGHLGNLLFSQQDAHGAIRRGVVVASCDSLNLLNQIRSNNPQLDVLIQLLNPPAQSQVCPSNSQGPVPPKAGKQRAESREQSPPAASPTPGRPVLPKRPGGGR